MKNSTLDLIMQACDKQVANGDGAVQYLDKDKEFYATYDINDGEPIIDVVINHFNVDETLIKRYIYNLCINAYNEEIDERAFRHYVVNLRY